MTINYTWKITNLNTKNVSNTQDVIVMVGWEKIGTDENGNTSSFFGVTNFNSENTISSEFIPFESLDENTVISWIISNIPEPYDLYINEKINEKINENYPIEKTLPWITVSN